MQKIKLTDYQVKSLRDRLSFTYDQVEDMILDKYKEMIIEDLNFGDYEDIVEMIQDAHGEITSNLV